MRRLCVSVVLALATSIAPAHADTHRVAIVVGNNRGAADETPLHFAEADAAKLARVLGELGGVAADDMFVLQGKSLAALTATFQRATRRIAQVHADPQSRAILVFYFSGHSDGEALELGDDRLPYAELRRALAGTGADVRVALVDSCKSGALIVVKGGHRGPAFQIRLADDVASTGEALLTSSAADEVALESREIGGSFFTHHFVSGLRGAADTSGDGIVTLTEAYHYAYAHTIATTGATLIGPQHPTYDYRLTGQGELVLTDLTHPSASIELPGGLDRGLVIEAAHDQVVAELPADAHPMIAVPAGTYTVRAWKQGAVRAARIAVAANQRRAVAWDELHVVDATPTTVKGPSAPPASSVLVAGGATTGIAARIGVVPTVRGELRLANDLVVSVHAGSATLDMGVRETASSARIGYRRGVARGSIRAWAGLDVGFGVVVQTLPGLPTAYSGTAIASPAIGVDMRVSPRLSLGALGALDVTVLRRDNVTAVVPLPAVWAGVIVGL
jgi:hypothetical protein